MFAWVLPTDLIQKVSYFIIILNKLVCFQNKKRAVSRLFSKLINACTCILFYGVEIFTRPYKERSPARSSSEVLLVWITIQMRDTAVYKAVFKIWFCFVFFN